jgi:glycosyltransferase involved in cell wall biosynthesis
VSARSTVSAREAIPIRVLHVMVRGGGGQATAAQMFMSATPDFDHHLLVARDDSCQLGEAFERAAVSTVDFPATWGARAKALRERVEVLRPDVIHAHSSFAGALARLALPARWRKHVVYTPHCYSYFRRDVGLATRAAFYVAEAMLALRTRNVAACSPLEVRAARRLPGRTQVHYTPNVILDISPSIPRPRRIEGRPLRVVSIGRLTAAKQAELFGEAAEQSRDLGRRIQWTWIGGGDEDQAAALRGSGVVVTGWVPREQCLEQLADADVYVHTARWESAPMTVLEAAVLDVPVLARDIPALRALGLAPLWRDIPELLRFLDDYPDGPAFDLARRSAAGLRDRHTLNRVRDGLLGAYAGAAGVRLDQAPSYA